MHFFYTAHQTPRGAKPDGQFGNKIYLIKNVSKMRLTYQIKVLSYMAESQGKILIIQLPKQAAVHKSLKDFVRELARFVKIERV
ncbi:hypothetical protein [Achromobacter pestifer]